MVVLTESIISTSLQLGNGNGALRQRLHGVNGSTPHRPSSPNSKSLDIVTGSHVLPHTDIETLNVTVGMTEATTTQTSKRAQEQAHIVVQP